MTCQMTHDRLWSFVHDELDDAAARAEIESHISGCDSCRSQVEDMRELLGELDGIGLSQKTAAPPRPPERIRGYRILRKIGQGGMGVVYEAEQPSPLRRVALKVILGGVHADEVQLRMFQREVQTLARLNHPGIAAIYDAGQTEDGQSYYAMELVDGVTLHQHVRQIQDATDAAKWPLRDLLRLFHAICEAISYAHQRGVIHRDLKPSNIILAENARPKVLDFGLARLIEHDPAAPTINTESGRLMGTLPYMSPEQAVGRPEAIDVRTDVYALGVILYEMLTGTLPCDVARRPLPEAVRIICEQHPRSPSRVNPAVPGDLATIALKALEKEPERRYQSAAAMADDVDRFLNGHPVSARPPSSLYYLRKAVARHKVTTALSVALVLLGFVFAGVTYYNLLRVVEESRRRERVNMLFADVYKSVNPWNVGLSGNKDVTVLETLDRVGEEIATRLSDDELTAATLRATLASQYKAFGKHDSAHDHFRYALDVMRRVLGDDHPETVSLMTELGENCYMRGSLDEAELLFREAMAARRESLSPPDERIAVNLNNLGLVLKTRGKLDEAEALYREALLMRQRVLRSALTGSPADTAELATARNHVAATLNNLAALMRERRRLDEADQFYMQALQLRRDALNENHPDVAKMYNNYGKLLYDRGDFARAEENFRRSLDILRRGLGDEHAWIARAMHSLAMTLRARGDREAALAECRAALDMRQRLLDRKDMDAKFTDLADSLELLGVLLTEQGDAVAAETPLREAVRISREGRPPGDWRTASAESALGACLAEQGRLDEARPLLVGSLELLRTLRGEDQMETREAAERLSRFRELQPAARDNTREAAPAP